MSRLPRVRRVLQKALPLLAVPGLFTAALVGGAVAAGPASAATQPATATAPTAPVKVTGVKLTTGTGSGSTRTYEATVFDSTGAPVANADLDLGGLGADPDLRVPTTPMKATATPGTYAATVTYPADGDWVLVVRVHRPSQDVELFSENIVGAGAAPSHHDLSASPSRRAVIAADPTFYQRYDPTTRPVRSWRRRHMTMHLPRPAPGWGPTVST
jgi:hypothetical protein